MSFSNDVFQQCTALTVVVHLDAEHLDGDVGVDGGAAGVAAARPRQVLPRDDRDLEQQRVGAGQAGPRVRRGEGQPVAHHGGLEGQPRAAVGPEPALVHVHVLPGRLQVHRHCKQAARRARDVSLARKLANFHDVLLFDHGQCRSN